MKRFAFLTLMGFQLRALAFSKSRFVSKPPFSVQYSRRWLCSSPIEPQCFRINKCLPHLSRRAADDAVGAGRVTINGITASSGQRVLIGERVCLDGVNQEWEPLLLAKQMTPSTSPEQRALKYIKYWKPKHVTCTSDRSDPTNIIMAGNFHLLSQRLFSVGRLDKASTGLILLTSDGRVPEAILTPSMRKEKTYEVVFNRAVTEEQLQQLREGVVISTPIKRDNIFRMHTAKTLPCQVSRINVRTVRITLTEGRNRQIRRMAQIVGLEVIVLHRTGFCGVDLSGLREGEWKDLTESEMKVILAGLDSWSRPGTGNRNNKELQSDTEDWD